MKILAFIPSTFSEFALLSALACLALLAALTLKYKARPLKGVPMPYHAPLIGIVGEVWKQHDRLHDWVSDQYRELGNRTWTLAGPIDIPFVFLARAEDIEYVLKTNFSNYEKGERFATFVKEFLGEGIFATDGEKWRDHRKIASHMFAMKVLKTDMFRVFQQQSQEVLDIVSTVPKGSSIDMGSIFYRFTMDAMCEVSFGINLGTLRKADEFASAFDTVQNISANRHIDPTWIFRNKLQVGTEKILTENMKKVNRFCYKVINDRRKKIAEDLKEFDPHRTYPDLLSCFMNTWAIRGEDKSNLYYRDVICNFMIAGRDTTAVLLSWFFWEISENPKVLEKIREEIKNVCPSGHPQYDELRSLVYLEAALLEALRLHPSVPLDFKVSVKEDTLPDGTKIPPNTGVAWSAYAMARQPENWGPDCCEFKPERFIDTNDDKVRNMSQYLFNAFNAGPRLCLGKHVAIMEAKTLCVSLLSRFTPKMAEGEQKPHYELSLTLPMKGPLNMVMEPYQL